MPAVLFVYLSMLCFRCNTYYRGRI